MVVPERELAAAGRDAHAVIEELRVSGFDPQS